MTSRRNFGILAKAGKLMPLMRRRYKSTISVIVAMILIALGACQTSKVNCSIHFLDGQFVYQCKTAPVSNTVSE
jgi:hypothetical protein